MGLVPWCMERPEGDACNPILAGGLSGRITPIFSEGEPSLAAIIFLGLMSYSKSLKCDVGVPLYLAKCLYVPRMARDMIRGKHAPVMIFLGVVEL